MTLRSFPQQISRGNANASLDLYPSVEQRLVDAISESAHRGAVKALANAFMVSEEAIYHRADGQTRTCWHDCKLWLDTAIRAKGQTPAGRRAALAPLRLLVELYLTEDAAANELSDVYAVLGAALGQTGQLATMTTDALRDGEISAEERERIAPVVVALLNSVPALARKLGLDLSPANEVAK